MGRTSIQVSDELADELYRRKGRGESYEDVVWRLIDRADSAADSKPRERPHDGENSVDGHEPGTATDEPEPEQQRREKGHARVDAAKDRVHELDLPGSGERQQRREAGVLDLYQHLMNHAGEVVTTQELKAEIDADDVDYASVGSFWTNCVKSSGDRPNALLALPGVEELGGGRYHYDESEVYSE